MSTKYAIFCDEIRQEMNGKYFVIGCYSRDAMVPSFPATLGLSALVACETPSQKFEFNAQFSLRSGADLGSVTMEIEGDGRATEFAHVPLPKIMVSLSSEDDIILSTWVTGSPPTEAARLHVKKNT